ncbi:MAG: Fe-S cluster assembly protein SufD [Planctomycetota bacterium]
MVAMLEQENNAYPGEFSRIEKELAKVGSPALLRQRKAAIARFGEVGFPTTHDEEWRFTDVAPIAKAPLALPEIEDGVPPPEARSSLAGDGYRLSFVNGYRPVFEQQGAKLPTGVIVASLAEALVKHKDLVEPHLAHHARVDGSAFTALNTAFFRDGAFVHIPKGVVVSAPIHLQFLATTRPFAWQRRTLIVAGENSQATIVEGYDGADGNAYFTNAVTEVVALPGAVLDHYKVQREGKSAFHVGTMQVTMQRGSTFTSHGIALGGGLVRNDANAVLDAEGCTCTLNGLYLASGQQLIDNHTRIDHAKPNCVSHELYKGILDGKARGVFNGKIYVHPNAQKTDAKQTNKTLLLSDDAVINTKPQLEIYADDVKCMHGATIGPLDADSIFYLRSRGIGLAEARCLLTFAFANDIIRRIQVAPIRAQLEDVLLAAQHLPRGEEAP